MTDQEKLQRLIESIKTITNTIDNCSPDMALWEIRRVAAMIEDWESDSIDKY